MADDTEPHRKWENDDKLEEISTLVTVGISDFEWGKRELVITGDGQPLKACPPADSKR